MVDKNLYPLLILLWLVDGEGRGNKNVRLEIIYG